MSERVPDYDIISTCYVSRGAIEYLRRRRDDTTEVQNKTTEEQQSHKQKHSLVPKSMKNLLRFRKE